MIKISLVPTVRQTFRLRVKTFAEGNFESFFFLIQKSLYLSLLNFNFSQIKVDNSYKENNVYGSCLDFIWRS